MTVQTQDQVKLDFSKKMPWNVEELERLYNQTSSGHWFDRDTMRFFKTRLTPHFRRIDDKTALFITTEQGPSGQRKATVRLAKITDSVREDGALVSKISIETVGDFNSMTLYIAKKFMSTLKIEDYI